MILIHKQLDNTTKANKDKNSGKNDSFEQHLKEAQQRGMSAMQKKQQALKDKLKEQIKDGGN